jgi:hypothetical protein
MAELAAIPIAPARANEAKRRQFMTFLPLRCPRAMRTPALRTDYAATLNRKVILNKIEKFRSIHEVI